MWCDWDAPELKGDDSIYRPELRFDRSLWDDLLKKMQQAGMNMVVIDLGDGVKYESHPEIAVKGAWSTAELRSELQRMRSLGLEPIPKLNFSTTHDAWLGKYCALRLDRRLLCRLPRSDRRGDPVVRPAPVLPPGHGRGGLREPEVLRARRHPPV